MIESTKIHQLYSLFFANKENSIEIKNLVKRYLVSGKLFLVLNFGLKKIFYKV